MLRAGQHGAGQAGHALGPLGVAAEPEERLGRPRRQRTPQVDLGHERAGAEVGRRPVGRTSAAAVDHPDVLGQPAALRDDRDGRVQHPSEAAGQDRHRGAVDDGVHPQDDRARHDGAVPQHRRGGEARPSPGPRTARAWLGGGRAARPARRSPRSSTKSVRGSPSGRDSCTTIASKRSTTSARSSGSPHHRVSSDGRRSGWPSSAWQARPRYGCSASVARRARAQRVGQPDAAQAGGVEQPGHAPCRCRRRARGGRRRRRRSGGAARRPAPARRASAARPDRGAPSGRRLRPGCSRAARPGRSARSSWGGRGRT